MEMDDGEDELNNYVNNASSDGRYSLKEGRNKFPGQFRFTTKVSRRNVFIANRLLIVFFPAIYDH